MRNRLLRALAREDQDRVAPNLEFVTIASGQVIHPAGQPIEHVYFPASGIASVVAIDKRGRRMEAGPFGWDGMSGIPLLLESDRSPHETLVQMPGEAWRMPAASFLAALRESPAFHSLCNRYVHAFFVQTAQTALAAGIAVVEQRLARWLLMVHDRVEGDEFKLTHDFIALMLAVRRPGVTVALHELEGRGLIRSRRGLVIIRDRDGLMALCDGLYGVAEAEYRRLIPDV